MMLLLTCGVISDFCRQLDNLPDNLPDEASPEGITDVSPPCQFAPWTIGPLDVSPPGRFAPKTFRPLDDSPPRNGRFAPLAGNNKKNNP